MSLTNLQPVIDNPVTMKAAATLPPLGAWDAAVMVEVAPAGFDWVMLYFTYTQAAVGGAVDFQIQISPYTVDSLVVENWFSQAAYAVGAVVAGADTTSAIQREIVTYGSTVAGAAQMFTYGPVRLDGTVERIRIRTRESGVTATPGDCHIIGMFYN